VPAAWNTPKRLSVGPDKAKAMSREQLERQADRADTLADRTVDEDVKENLRPAAKEYREKAKREA
jgi:electron transfer flavoprotein alpha/beta subunit